MEKWKKENMLSSSMKFKTWRIIMSHLSCLPRRIQQGNGRISGRGSQSEISSLLGFPQDGNRVIGSRGMPHSLLAPLL